MTRRKRKVIHRRFLGIFREHSGDRPRVEARRRAANRRRRRR